jgi:hypothetical protein
VLRILTEPGGDQFLETLLGGLSRLLDDGTGNDKRIELPGPGVLKSGRIRSSDGTSMSWSSRSWADSARVAIQAATTANSRSRGCVSCVGS